MHGYHAIRELPKKGVLRDGDYLVLFGELFSRGYANGLINMANHRGLTVVRTTVGRREKDGSLRPLNATEVAEIPQPFINIPLEAGFDMEMADGKEPFIDCTKNVKLNDWENFSVDKSLLQKAVQMGRDRFTHSVRQFVAELEKIVPENKNVYFAHLMAGGVPRTRMVMPLMNKVFKGTGERHLASETFWKSGIGQITERNFSEVSAETFQILIKETTAFREKRSTKGATVSYSGYGYHGTEVLLKNNYTWQSYAPYLQGWAKLKLEEVAREWSKSGVKCSVYNCPEILTNSSSIFQGVEVPLYPLLQAFEKEDPGGVKGVAIRQACQKMLKPGESVDSVLQICEKTLSSPEIRAQSDFEKWPQHNTKAQMETLLSASDAIIEKHLDPKNLMTIPLSEIIFSACGRIMFEDVCSPAAPVSWINHDVVAKWLHAY